MMKWIWITLGATAGYVLGTRAGREQFNRIAGWTKGASKDVGLSMAAERIADSARTAGTTMHDAATTRSQSVLGDVADAVAGRIDAATDAVSSSGG
jgi:hypothetical protein